MAIKKHAPCVLATCAHDRLGAHRLGDRHVCIARSSTSMRHALTLGMTLICASRVRPSISFCRNAGGCGATTNGDTNLTPQETAVCVAAEAGQGGDTWHAACRARRALGNALGVARGISNHRESSTVRCMSYCNCTVREGVKWGR